MSLMAYINGKVVQAEGALPNGSRIEKINSKNGDGHQDGAQGKVVSSIGPIYVAMYPDKYFYFVEWEDLPGVHVGVTQSRVKEVTP